LDGWAKALFLELRDNTLKAAVLFDQAIDRSHHSGAHRTADKTVQETHFNLLNLRAT
jgi:hypothetical protein